MGTNSLAASDTGWLGIPGHRLVCERSADRNPGNHSFALPQFSGREARNEKKSVGVIMTEMNISSLHMLDRPLPATNILGQNIW